ncbi:glycosyltransferase family 4 protein [Aquirufa ecclesiirivi]|uniref:glycosyltransferase family 4 protein n=1 Tax=Aquirufa ecclesiirivi TaxID=2715124 RepID=UPI00140CD3F2|nr:glycosyltransferase [Aquirufa ecclesiirivi]NHC48159.1 glycosyltransferase [Aquirufa ecclesiirivi]
MNKILIITPYFYPSNSGGGGQVSIENLAFSLVENHEVEVLCNLYDVKLKKNISNVDFQIYKSLKIYYLNFSNFFKIIKIIKEKRFDFIYFNSFFSPICIFFQFFFFKSKVKILSPKGEFYEGALKSKSLKKRFFLIVFRRINFMQVFHATSTQEITTIAKLFPEAKIKLARDIPSQVMSISDRLGSSTSDKCFKVIFCSSLVPKKNLEFVINLLSQTNLKVDFDIWGQIVDKKYFEKIQNLLNTLPENINWEYKGELLFKESKFIFSNYDLFIFPTLGENYGHVIYESLACGCPILLSKGSTPWENLEENLLGYNLEILQPFKWLEKIEYFHGLNLDERKIRRNICIEYIRQNSDFEGIKIENQKLFIK